MGKTISISQTIFNFQDNFQDNFQFLKLEYTQLGN